MTQFRPDPFQQPGRQSIDHGRQVRGQCAGHRAGLLFRMREPAIVIHHQAQLIAGVELILGQSAAMPAKGRG